MTMTDTENRLYTIFDYNGDVVNRHLAQDQVITIIEDWLDDSGMKESLANDLGYLWHIKPGHSIRIEGIDAEVMREPDSAEQTEAE
jgi:hypothetical protein